MKKTMSKILQGSQWVNVINSNDLFMRELINTNGYIKFEDGSVARWNDDWDVNGLITHYKINK